MWLIDTSTLKLNFVTEAEKGSYAVLSHTWGENEVTFEQFRSFDPRSLDDACQQTRFVKITKTCELAAQHGLSYAWIDTCCIDKSSSAELSEAINSMFRYYQDAAFCIAFISDLSGPSDPATQGPDFGNQFPHCRWLTRGWTLQEMIAPPQVFFFDSTWTFRGSKHDWKGLLSKATGVGEAVLDNQMELRFVPVAQRFSWASKRQTTRIEDMAYCLLGIFNVNMPLIYGEGRRAFIRLQEEIAKESYDLSLFAWQQLDYSQNYRGILARSPEEFYHCGEMKHRIKGAIFPTEFTLTNRGLRIETAAMVSVPTASHDFIWNLGFSYRDDWPINTSLGWLGIYLAKTQDGFVRARPSELFQAGSQTRIRCPMRLMHIRKTVDVSESLEIDRRFERAIKVILHQALSWPQFITLEAFVPEALWVENEAAFLHQGRGINAYIRGKVGLSEANLEPIILACSTMDTPICAIWDSHDRWWAELDAFLNISNERTDFVAADYLRAHFPYQELSSKAVKNFEVQELKECTSNEGELRFIWQINALPHHQLGHQGRAVTISTRRVTSWPTN
ncbi:heterokaryon incompatibility protein-domain-containing protein [Xylaria bambusicola]|uniref:heterokaryon incompatibility protein-domain-containing protein n=1 Tax=Xylaria bambusicola TaxID=326684 RepID=UPI0020075054|nr:heterokaryon incompatibility protein-domain-containing protein [Xylaria bambusicola]KAI0506412.1 heterokaryon incompatibility protein-domain-containing protein [Xylaria bambusicola]